MSIRNPGALIAAVLLVAAISGADPAPGLDATPEEATGSALPAVAYAQGLPALGVEATPDPSPWKEGHSALNQSPNLGVEATPEEVSEWDISIEPDGEGLPPGSGTAIEGEPVYTLYCFSCHGVEGQGLLNDVLVGGHGTLTGSAPLKTVGSFWPYATTVFDYIRRTMPYQQPQSLSDDQVYALTAYLLFLNGIIEEHEAMDAKTLPEVRMPNRDNFILAYPPPENESSE